MNPNGTDAAKAGNDPLADAVKYLGKALSALKRAAVPAAATAQEAHDAATAARDLALEEEPVLDALHTVVAKTQQVARDATTRGSQGNDLGQGALDSQSQAARLRLLAEEVRDVLSRVEDAQVD